MLWFLQVLHVHLYPALFVLHGTVGSFSFWQRGHIFSAHFSVLKGYLLVNNFSILSPPCSKNLILSSEFLLSSSSLCCNSLINLPPGVGGTKTRLLYWTLDFSFFHQLNFHFICCFCHLLIPMFYFYITVWPLSDHHLPFSWTPPEHYSEPLFGSF